MKSMVPFHLALKRLVCFVQKFSKTIIFLLMHIGSNGSIFAISGRGKTSATNKNMAQKQTDFKTSFPPISDSDIEVLILGTLPGDRSLESGEYFAHPRNRFWKIISAITNNPLPESYSEKMELLHRSKIGVWNVLHKASRKGSLDAAIQNEVPNELPAFIAKHKKLKVIGFDGLKAEALYDKYFSRRNDLTYISLPSCSPANARFNIEALCDRWIHMLSPKPQ